MIFRRNPQDPEVEEEVIEVEPEPEDEPSGPQNDYSKARVVRGRYDDDDVYPYRVSIYYVCDKDGTCRWRPCLEVQRTRPTYSGETTKWYYHTWLTTMPTLEQAAEQGSKLLDAIESTDGHPVWMV